MSRILACLVVAAVSMNAAAEEYHDPVNRFTVVIPAGWSRMSDAQVRELDVAMDAIAPARGFHFTAGFTQDPLAPMKGSYVLVQCTPGDFSGQTWEDLEKALGAAGVDSAVKDAVSKAGMDPAQVQTGTLTLDRATGRTHLSLAMSDAAGRTLKGECTGFLGRAGVVQFNCYAEESKFAAVRGDFDALIASFHYEPGAEFAAATPAQKFWNGSGGRIVVWGVIGAAAGLMTMYMRRRSEKSAASVQAGDSAGSASAAGREADRATRADG